VDLFAAAGSWVRPPRWSWHGARRQRRCSTTETFTARPMRWASLSRARSASFDRICRRCRLVWIVISGGAKGVDQIAMSAGLGAGGDVVGVLAGSLERRVREPEVRRLVAEEQLCLVTPYAPKVGFSVGNAMGRNKLIYALARSTFVVCADDRKGGTWKGAREALSSGFCPVLAWLGPGRGPGNEQLIEEGAVPVHELDRLVDVALSAPMPTTASRSRARRGGSGRGRPLAGESDRQLGLGFG